MYSILCFTGHSAVLQGCTVEDEAFVGMGATLLDGVVVEKHGMVAAGALVRQNTRIPCGEVHHFCLSSYLGHLRHNFSSYIN
jgi:carbonic anhydrase/acetyltransferase-like protein (isoleucine patch superfamily)